MIIREHLCRTCRLPRSDSVILARAEFLTQEERDLVEAVVIEGQQAKAVARMMRMTPRGVSYHIRRLARRMASEEFIRTIRALAYLGPEDAHIARRWFCQSATQEELVVETGMTLHNLRRKLDRIRARIDMIATQRIRAETFADDEGAPTGEPALVEQGQESHA